MEQRDLETDSVVDRFVFDRRRLIRHEATVSSNTRTSTVFDHDGFGRLIRRTTCTTSSGGEPSAVLQWRKPMVQYDGPFTSVDREERTYATPAARVPVFGTVVNTSRFDGKVVSTETRVCNVFDGSARRTERVQIYRMSDRPNAFDSTIHRYAYTAAGVRSMTATTLNLDRRLDRSFGVRFEMEWTARFSYNKRGLQTAVDVGDSRTTLHFDARGRLTNYSSVTVAWDERDRIVATTGLGPGYDCTYHYDAGGRLTDADYGQKQGYRLTYSAGCPDDLVHPAIGPSIDNYLYYEGKDRL